LLEPRRRRAVVEGGCQLALDGIDAQPEPFEGVGAQHIEIARIAEEAHGVKGSSLESARRRAAATQV